MVNRLKFLNSLVADIVLLFLFMITHFNGFLVEVVADIGFLWIMHCDGILVEISK